MYLLSKRGVLVDCSRRSNSTNAATCAYQARHITGVELYFESTGCVNLCEIISAQPLSIAF
jgi:hypothetical protein